MYKLTKKYSNQPVLRVLIQLVPFGIGSAIDTLLQIRLNNIQSDRTKHFFDELEKGNILLDEKLLKSEDFLHKFFITTNVALKTRRREKIIMFAKLLKNSFSDENIDEYEEYLSILDELSYREIRALIILDKYYKKHILNTNENNLEHISPFWNEYINELQKELNIDNMEATSFLSRIARTGCYELINGSYYNYNGGVGKLTKTWEKIKSIIES